MGTPPMLQTNDHDEETATLETLAANAREERDNNMRRHLRSHLELNPQSTYVSWVATLHPENAAIMIDPRFYAPGNPWLTVYEETKASIFTPIAVAHPIPSKEQEAPSDRPTEEKPTTETLDPIKMTMSTRTVCVGRGGLIGLDKITGPWFVLVAAIATLALELHCTIFCILSNAFLFAARALGEPNLITALLIGAFVFVGHLTAMLDLLTLLIGVLVVEVLAISCGFVCFVLSCCSCHVGSAWHQSVRRVSHLIRWAFRNSFQNSFLSRHNFLTNENNDAQPNNEPSMGAPDNHVSATATATTNEPNVVVVVENPQKLIIHDVQPVVLPHVQIDEDASGQHTTPRKVH